MASLPVQVVLGVYLGLLTGIIPAMVAWVLGFTFKYFTGISIPAFAVIVLSLAIAGANGGLLALNDPTIRAAPNSVTLTTAIILILMISLYAHAQGDKMGETFPHHISFRSIRERTLSRDVVELVGGRGQVRVTVARDVADLEGYPPLTPGVRAEIRQREYTFPADLPLTELESRFEDKLRAELDLAAATVSIDENARASVAAAPPTSGISKRIPPGHRAVSIDALVPTGLAHGDNVAITAGDTRVDGTIVSAQSSKTASPIETESANPESPAGTPDTPATEAAEAPTTTGGEGRLTVAVPRSEAKTLLELEPARVVVKDRGTRREFELIALLKRAHKRFRKLAVGESSSLAGTTVGEAAISDRYDVTILAVKHESEWALAPRGATELSAGDELFAVGTRENLDRFATTVTQS